MVATAARYTRLAELVLPILRPGWSAISSDLTLEPHGKTESLRFAVVVPVGGVYKKTDVSKCVKKSFKKSSLCTIYLTIWVCPGNAAPAAEVGEGANLCFRP